MASAPKTRNNCWSLTAFQWILYLDYTSERQRSNRIDCCYCRGGRAIKSNTPHGVMRHKGAREELLGVSINTLRLNQYTRRVYSPPSEKQFEASSKRLGYWQSCKICEKLGGNVPLRPGAQVHIGEKTRPCGRSCHRRRQGEQQRIKKRKQ